MGNCWSEVPEAFQQRSHHIWNFCVRWLEEQVTDKGHTYTISGLVITMQIVCRTKPRLIYALSWLETGICSAPPSIMSLCTSYFLQFFARTRICLFGKVCKMFFSSPCTLTCIIASVGKNKSTCFLKLMQRDTRLWVASIVLSIEEWTQLPFSTGKPSCWNLKTNICSVQLGRVVETVLTNVEEDAVFQIMMTKSFLHFPFLRNHWDCLDVAKKQRAK